MEHSTTLTPHVNVRIELDPILHRKMKVAAAIEGIAIRDFIVSAIEKSVADKKTN